MSLRGPRGSVPCVPTEWKTQLLPEGGTLPFFLEGPPLFLPPPGFGPPLSQWSADGTLGRAPSEPAVIAQQHPDSFQFLLPIFFLHQFHPPYWRTALRRPTHTARTERDRDSPPPYTAWLRSSFSLWHPPSSRSPTVRRGVVGPRSHCSSGGHVKTDPGMKDRLAPSPPLPNDGGGRYYGRPSHRPP